MEQRVLGVLVHQRTHFLELSHNRFFTNWAVQIRRCICVSNVSSIVLVSLQGSHLDLVIHPKG